MTRAKPPGNFSGAVVVEDLPAETVLFRVHPVVYDAGAFNPVGSDALFGGGRFDGTEIVPYPYLYAGESDRAAVAEALLRDIAPNDRGSRVLLKKYWRGRRLSRLRTTVDVPLIAVRSGVELGAIGQDTWLTTCAADEYPQTRAWAHWLREQVPHAAGIMWLSKREPAATVYVLFEDRCPAGLLVDEPGWLAGPCVFEEPAGFEWLRTTLAAYRVGIRR